VAGAFNKGEISLEIAIADLEDGQDQEHENDQANNRISNVKNNHR
jgi:hypothetical protein